MKNFAVTLAFYLVLSALALLFLALATWDRNTPSTSSGCPQYYDIVPGDEGTPNFPYKAKDYEKRSC